MPITAKKIEQYGKRMDGLRKTFEDLQTNDLSQLNKTLNELRTSLLNKLGTAKSYEVQYLKDMITDVDWHMERIRTRITELVTGAQQNGWDNGIATIKTPLEIFEPSIGMAGISTNQLIVMQGYSADLVSNITSVARGKINAQITLAVMGQQNMLTTMDFIGRNLKDKSVFKTLADRAEAIYRTEVGRAQSIATQATMEQAVTLVPKLKKRWIYDHMAQFPRTGHMAMHNKVQDVNKPFIVMPMLAGKAPPEPMMFPRDPRASAANTIMCKCVCLPYSEDWEKPAEEKASDIKQIEIAEGDIF